MQKSYCIVCGKEKKGLEIEEDLVIGLIRWFKRNVTKNETGNKLVVCKDCYPSYKLKRKKYESRQRTYIALGIVFVVVSLLISHILSTIVVSLFVLLLLYLMSLLSYAPKISIKK